jgi:putative transposase
MNEQTSRPTDYLSNVSDENWALIASLFAPKGRSQRPRLYAEREVYNAISYVNRTGCAWRYLPKDFPPYRTVHRHFCLWAKADLFKEASDLLAQLVRKKTI